MSPEYLLHGQFSVKSDVYGFGVIVLEIISGRRATGFVYHSEAGENLLCYVSILSPSPKNMLQLTFVSIYI